MFNGVGWGEIAVLLLIGLFVFGPDRLPRVARDAGRMLRQIRQMAAGMRSELRTELGPELADLDIRDLHPKTFVRKHLLEGDEEPLPPSYLSKRTTMESLFGDDDTPSTPSLTKNRVPTASSERGSQGSSASLAKPTSTSTGSAASAGTRPPVEGARPVSTTKSVTNVPAARSEHAERQPAAAPFDTDAT